MSALDLTKRLKDGTSTCEGEGCIRKGRRKMIPVLQQVKRPPGAMSMSRAGRLATTLEVAGL